jgi:hypothetical protein
MYINWYHINPKGERLDIVQSPVNRQWMDDTAKGYAYRCLPMTFASQYGWAVKAPYDVQAVWDGTAEASGMKIICGRYTETNHIFADNGTGNGILTFHINAIPRTPPGWGIWIMPAPNLVIPGAQPLSAIIETDWSPSSPTMNWKFTDPGRLVTFKKGDPVFFFVPVNKTMIEEFSMQHFGIEDYPEIKGPLAKFINFREDKKTKKEDVFGKHYMRGQLHDGSTPNWEHTHITKTKLYVEDPNK